MCCLEKVAAIHVRLLRGRARVGDDRALEERHRLAEDLFEHRLPWRTVDQLLRTVTGQLHVITKLGTVRNLLESKRILQAHSLAGQSGLTCGEAALHSFRAACDQFHRHGPLDQDDTMLLEQGGSE